MAKVASGDPLNSAIRSLEAALERQTLTLTTLEARVAELHDDMRKSAEIITRLKLASDNAKQIALTHKEALDAVGQRLDGIEGRLGRG